MICHAQSTHILTVEVKNDVNSPIENATISINPCACGGLTNSRGLYRTSLVESSYSLTVSHISYSSKTIHFDLMQDQKIEVELIENEQELTEVVVTSKKRKDLIRAPEMGVLSFESLELKKIPAAFGEFDVLRSLTHMAGVNTAGEVSNGISVRGSTLDQNLILLDHTPVFNPTHLFGLFSVFTPDMIKSTDLYKSNIPARYGGRTAAATVVEVKNPYTDKFKMTGGIGLVSSRLAIESPIIKDRLMIGAGARAGFTGFLLPIMSKRLKNTKARFGDATLKLLYLPTDKDQLSFTGFYSVDFYQLDLITKIDNIISSTNQYHFKTLNGSVNWLHSFDIDKNLRTILSSGNYNPRLIFPQENSDNEIIFDSHINYLSLFSQYHNAINDHFDYNTGLQASQFRIRPGDLNHGSSTNVMPVTLDSEKSYELSVFAESNWKASNHLRISAGLRYTKYLLLGPYSLATYDEDGEIVDINELPNNEVVKSYGGLEPRLATSWIFNDKLSFKASYTRLNQYMQNIYNSTSPIPTSRWKSADSFINPQKGNSFSIGIYKNLDYNEMELSVEGYYKKMENILTYKPGADFFLEEFIEQDVVQGQGKAYGVEFTLAKPDGKVNGFLNYTWSRSYMRSTNSELRDRINNNNWFSSDFDRPHVFNAMINFEGKKYSTVSINFTFQSGQPYTVANGTFEEDGILIPVFLERNNSRLRPYHRLDLSWKIKSNLNQEKKWKSDWTVTVYNLYARKNTFNKYYSSSPTTNIEFSNGPLSAYEIFILNSPLISLSYNFTFN